MKNSLVLLMAGSGTRSGLEINKVLYQINQTPLFFTFTITGLFSTLIVFYLSFLCLIGKKPYLPVISDVVKSNFGGN